MTKKIFYLGLFCFVAASLYARETVSLAGQWRYFKGGAWLADQPAELVKPFTETVTLPGTTQTNAKGDEFSLNPAQQKAVDEGTVRDSRSPIMGVWTPVHKNIGAAFYQRDLDIPEKWAGKYLKLTLERTKMTRVWLDGKEVGPAQNGICVAQVYALGLVNPGKHVLTILVATGPFPRGVGGQHLGALQGNWNGIIGAINLDATDPVWIERVQVQPNIATRKATVKVFLGTDTARSISGELRLDAKSWNGTEHVPAAMKSKFGPTSDGVVTLEYDLGQNAQLWDEWTPVLYRLKVTLKTEGASPYRDERQVDFGMREFKREGTIFKINGKVTHLRGTHDGASFPLTGHPPMETESWLRIMKTAKAHGINHFRFHTWTPPEAALSAADIVGIYLQPELPSSAGAPYGEDKARDDYERTMGEQILREWSNHPSFVMLALGNEIAIKRPENRKVMTDIVNHFRTLDPTRLYSEGSNNHFGAPTLNPNDDYWTTVKVPSGDPKTPYAVIRSSFSGGNGWLNTQDPSTMTDYLAQLKLCLVPLIGHEVGQFAIFPDLNERKKYTGVYRLRNYDMIEKRMRANHLIEQNQAFFKASGQLSILCYREEIEAYLRTPGFGGFQLLDLLDFQGQGTSLVGILDAFHDSKGLITPEAWREFCSEIVPLVRMSKRTWTANETFKAEAQVAHYGAASLSGVEAQWSVKNATGNVLANGVLPKGDIPRGGVHLLGSITFPLINMAAPAQLTLELQLPGTPYLNRYPLWVYPATVDTATPQGLTVTRKLDEALAELSKGAAVVLLPDLKEIAQCSVKSGFETVFWNFCFANQPPTMGILCDPEHPLFEIFPTEFHSNWQWFWPTTKARAMVLTAAPADFRPVVQMIDNIETCRKLSLIWEAKVGTGRLIVCSSDLPAIQDKPEGRQLFSSLLRYAGSTKFQPKQELSAEAVRGIFSTNVVNSAQGARKDE